MDYQKGRYDELVDRHKELLEMYQRLLHEKPMGVHGASVNYFAGPKINPKTVGLTFSAGAIALAISQNFFGFSIFTASISVAIASITFSIFQFIKKTEEVA